MKNALLPVLCFISLSMFGQNQALIDSMIKVYEKTSIPHEKTKKILDVAWAYADSDPHKAIEFGNKALSYSRSVKDSLGEGEATGDMGVFYEFLADYDKAFEQYKKALAIWIKFKNPKSMCTSLNNIGNIYIHSDNYPMALAYYQQSLKIAEKIQNKKYIGSTLGNIGAVYKKSGNYKMAIENYNLSLSYLDSNTKYYYNALNNIGTTYFELRRYSNASIYYNKAFKASLLIGDKSGQARALSNLALCQLKMENIQLAESLFKAATPLVESLGNKELTSDFLSNYAGLLVKQNKNSEAKQAYKKSNLIAKEINALHIQKDNFFELSNMEFLAKDYGLAFNYRLSYDSIKDSILNETRTKQIAEMQTKYETEKKESEIKGLKQNERINNLEIAEQKLQIQKRNYTLIGGFLLLITLATGTYFWNEKQQLKHKLIKERAIKETEENERMRIAKDIHDDLGSGLSKINFLSEIITQKSDLHPEIKSSSESVSETARKMVDNMRDLIWALNPENATLANLVARVREYSSDYLEDFPIELLLTFPDTIPQTPITKESHRGIFMVVKESLNNIVKHAYSTEVKIVSQITTENFSITIEDNGIGFNTTHYSSGNGLRNMKNRIIAAGGSMNMQSEPKRGTRISITIPLAKVFKS